MVKILEAHKLPTIFSYRRACDEGYIQALKDVGEWLDNRGRIGFNQLSVAVWNKDIETLKRGEMPKEN